MHSFRTHLKWNQIARFPNLSLSLSRFLPSVLVRSLTRFVLFFVNFFSLYFRLALEFVCSLDHIKQIYKQFCGCFVSLVFLTFFLCYCVILFLQKHKCWCHLICHWFWSWFHTLNNSTNQFRMECTCGEKIVSFGLHLVVTCFGQTHEIKQTQF